MKNGGGKHGEKWRENGEKTEGNTGRKRRQNEMKTQGNTEKEGETEKCHVEVHSTGVQIRFEVSFSNILLKLGIKEAIELHLHMTSYDLHRSVINLTSSAV